jgi:phosphopantothenoylcysteine decarboxylase / phosphopantothenate---cysteine ligase
MVLKNKNILIGVSGSIAAYKITFLIRLLIKAEANVKIIMSEAAKDFITPLTLATLSKNPVLSEYYNKDNGAWHNHVELGLWADLMIVAPATANTISKCANGNCDNLLIATYLSARCKVIFAPAMDLDMYLHKSTQININKLISFGNHLLEPNEGELASGLNGKGRMVEPEEIFENVLEHFLADEFWKGKKVLISAGPTQEDLDPVRFISNHSSGKMGFEIARALKLAEAEVCVVAGPNNIKAKEGIKVLKVRSAKEMAEAMFQEHSNADIVIFAAAVADYTPKVVESQKIKKKENEMFLELTKTIDIAASLGLQKKEDQVHIGFALETNNELENASQKLNKKNFDMIVLNSLQDKGAGFRYDTNKITILSKKGEKQTFELKSKELVAKDLMDSIKTYMNRV